MKSTLLIMLALLLAAGTFAQDKPKKTKKEKTYNEKGEIIKKGWNFGPLPVVGYDADLGFQYGVTCDIFNFGDGSRYPRYNYKFNVEASRYTKGSGVFRFYSDMPYVVKDTKLFLDVTYFYAKKYEFFGFNGYLASPWNPYADLEKDGYHLINRNQFRFVGSMQRPFFDVQNLYWTAGLAYYNTHTSRIDTISMSDYAGQDRSLYEDYVRADVIKKDEAKGGNTAQLRLGLIYDCRDHNSDPTRGIYAEATIVGAGNISHDTYYSMSERTSLNLSYTFLWRQYIPIYNDKLTFAYRIGAQNRIVGHTPWYMINNLNTMFFQKMYTEGLGGSTTLRGVNRNGVVGEGFAFANLELRWRIINFQFINQNWIVALNPFFDAGMVTQKYREQVYFMGDKEIPHTSAGCGFKLIMNRNLVVSVDLGKALDKRDGEKLKTFVGFNYIF